MIKGVNSGEWNLDKGIVSVTFKVALLVKEAGNQAEEIS
jgi:hypothetical protein